MIGSTCHLSLHVGRFFFFNDALFYSFFFIEHCSNKLTSFSFMWSLLITLRGESGRKKERRHKFSLNYHLSGIIYWTLIFRQVWWMISIYFFFYPFYCHKLFLIEVILSAGPVLGWHRRWFIMNIILPENTHKTYVCSSLFLLDDRR